MLKAWSERFTRGRDRPRLFDVNHQGDFCEPVAVGWRQNFQADNAAKAPKTALKLSQRRCRRIAVIMAALSLGQSERVIGVVIFTHDDCHDGGRFCLGFGE